MKEEKNIIPELIERQLRIIKREWGPEVAAAVRAHNEKYGNRFDSRDLWEIAEAIAYFGHLPKSKFDIDLFTPEFDYKQLRQLRIAFEHGLTPEQVKFLANPDFTAEEMEEIKWHLKEFPLNLVKKYIPKIKAPNILREIRLAVVGKLKVDLKELLSYILKFRSLSAWKVNRVAKVLGNGYDKSLIKIIANAKPKDTEKIDQLLVLDT